jgi:hypothetical protein
LLERSELLAYLDTRLNPGPARWPNVAWRGTAIVRKRTQGESLRREQLSQLVLVFQLRGRLFHQFRGEISPFLEVLCGI